MLPNLTKGFLFNQNPPHLDGLGSIFLVFGDDYQVDFDEHDSINYVMVIDMCMR